VQPAPDIWLISILFVLFQPDLRHYSLTSRRPRSAAKLLGAAVTVPAASPMLPPKSSALIALMAILFTKYLVRGLLKPADAGPGAVDDHLPLGRRANADPPGEQNSTSPSALCHATPQSAARMCGR